MSTPRKQIADKINADYPTALDAYPWPYEPKELRRPAVMVMRESIDPGPQANSLAHGITIHAYTVHSIPDAKAEDAADDLLDQVLMSLQRLDVLTKVTAKRVVLADKFQGWTITAEWLSNDIYKTQVHTER